MALENVVAEIVVGVAPHGVDVVAAILRRVVLDQEARTLYAIVMLCPARRRSRPGEAQIFDAQGKLLASGRGTYFTAPPPPPKS